MRRPRQVNIRVNEETYDVLEAAVFVQRLRGFQELLAPLLESEAKRLRGDRKVSAALHARESER